MSRIAGRNGRIYLDVPGGGAASPLPFQAKWSLSFSTDKYDVTALGDANKTYVAGLADASGDFSGFYDNATAQTYTGAVDGVARKFYLYPDTTLVTQYFFGTIFVDMKIDADVQGAVAVSSSWNSASLISKVG